METTFTTIGAVLNHPLTQRLAASLVAILVVVLAVRVASRLSMRLVGDADVRYRTRKVTGFTGFVVALIAVGAIFSNQLGSLTVALGVTGAGIAFALQEVIASVAGWLAILFGRFFKVGDRVRLGGIRGDVIDVGVLRTTLMECGEWVNGDLYNGRIVRVANSFVFKEPVYNYSADFPFLWDEIRVPVGFGSDVTATTDLLMRVADGIVGEYATKAEAGWRDVVRRYRIEDARVAPMISLAADENWMTFTVRYVVDYRARRSTQDRLWRRLLTEIDAVPDKVRLATATLEISATTIPVRSVD